VALLVADISHLLKSLQLVAEKDITQLNHNIELDRIEEFLDVKKIEEARLGFERLNIK
jgi:hypothetical protein